MAESCLMCLSAESIRGKHSTLKQKWPSSFFRYAVIVHAVGLRALACVIIVQAKGIRCAFD
jgi:hypothetical protein